MRQTTGLDFLRSPARAGAHSWLLLALGVAAAAAFAWDHARARAEHAAAEIRLAQQRPPAARATPRTQRVDPAEQGRHRAELEAQRQLNLPWGILINRLQTERSADVALLALEADGRRGDFQLTADARDHPAMLAYVRRLRAAPDLRDVALTRHASAQSDGVAVVNFTLRGQWTPP